MNYNNGKIYKIVNDITDETYVGSTTQRLCKRMDTHRARARKGIRSSKLYLAMRKHGIDKFRVVLLEDYKCNNVDQLHAREEYYRNLLNATLNTNCCNPTKETTINRQRAYKKSHAQAIKEYQTMYRQKNIDAIRAKDREYFRINKDKLQYRKETINCSVCGGHYKYTVKTRHERSIKHCTALAKLKTTTSKITN